MKRDQAKTLLLHYFTLAGVVGDSDNRCEVEGIVDLIFDGVKQEVMEEVRKLLPASSGDCPYLHEMCEVCEQDSVLLDGTCSNCGHVTGEET